VAKIVKVNYFTSKRKALINPKNIELYEKYRKSNIIKNREVEETTYSTYNSNFTQFLVYLAEAWDNIGLYSEEFFENAVDIIEGYMAFCQDTLLNHKKTVNNKVAAISSFYLWSVKRRLIDFHPFDKRVDRMKGANEEHIINSYFLTDEQIEQIKKGLEDTTKFDIIDKLLFSIMLDSANRIGAIDKLKISNLDMDNCVFTNIREKRGYRVEVPVSQETLELIQEWFEIRKAEKDNLEVDAIFISFYGQHYRQMDKSTLQSRIQKIGTIIGLEDFHAHCIRKTTLNLITEKTGDISLAADLANHKSIETTRSAYVKPKSKSEVMSKIRDLMNKKVEIQTES
jgi:integrase/recombinase XerC